MVFVFDILLRIIAHVTKKNSKNVFSSAVCQSVCKGTFVNFCRADEDKAEHVHTAAEENIVRTVYCTVVCTLYSIENFLIARDKTQTLMFEFIYLNLIILIVNVKKKKDL